MSPVAALPMKTLLHGTAHFSLGHVAEGGLAETERTPRDLRDIAAEALALLCGESHGLPGAEYSRGYIQSWGQGQAISERSTQHIFHAAEQILRTGYPDE